ncbi:hypothetical protein KP509_04G064300 [Ceratopteris richardii]|uniref:Beta-glucosidase n=1 Tax=Ceratopteris richardii TaxID=49495 RepID=A0A8T2UXP0_CERRI|nr:hypothetical protein KP509_04G064300 [Ceratopteris richardii]
MVASRRALDFHLGWFLRPLVFGDYPGSMKRLVGNRLPTFHKGSTNRQQASVKGSFDFIGLNHYTTTFVKAGHPSYIVASLHNINPDGHFQVCCMLSSTFLEPIFVCLYLIECACTEKDKWFLNILCICICPRMVARMPCVCFHSEKFFFSFDFFSVKMIIESTCMITLIFMVTSRQT